MKRTLFLLVVVIIAVVATRFLFFQKKEKTGAPEEKQQPLTIGENTSAFNQSYNTLLAAYIGLKDALIAGDTTKVNAAAGGVKTAADNLKVDDIQGDSSGDIKATARSFASTISGSAQNTAAEGSLSAKRKEFELIAEALWNLTRTVKYDGQKLFWHYCPMAFNNRGAYWLSDNRQVRNPYFGHEMLECGSVQDSLDYSAKN